MTILHLLCFLAGMGLMFLIMKYIYPNWQYVYSWMFNLRRNERLGGVCACDLELDRKGYSLGYCYNKRTALWVSYVLSKTSTTIDKDRAVSFLLDPDIPEKHRVRPEDYEHSGYDKGHLAPSSGIDYSRKSNDETFYMSNIALQHPHLNRYAWKSLEQKIQKWVKTKGKLFVVAGPVFKKRNKRVNGVAVPSFFYKVLYQSREQQAIAFLFPNEEVKTASLWEHAMSVQDLEKIIGYTFFQKLSNRKRRSKMYVDLEWWQA